MLIKGKSFQNRLLLLLDPARPTQVLWSQNSLDSAVPLQVLAVNSGLVLTWTQGSEDPPTALYLDATGHSTRFPLKIPESAILGRTWQSGEWLVYSWRTGRAGVAAGPAAGVNSILLPLTNSRSTPVTRLVAADS